jgi:RNA polymerase sigma factor (sigma-70 family)
MKELEVEVRVRNNRLKQRRLALGLTQAQLAQAASVPPGAYAALETLTRAPQIGGRWRGVALRLAEFHCVQPQELFPESALAVTQPTVKRRIDGCELTQFLLASAPTPDALHDVAERERAVLAAVGTLAPRERHVIARRFGLGATKEATCEEIAKELEVGRERIRQIEMRALRKLRHPSKSKELAEFEDCTLEGDL